MRRAWCRVQRGGGISRARVLERIKEADDDDSDVRNLLLGPYVRDAAAEVQGPWRGVVSFAGGRGIGVPAFASARAYYDGYRTEAGPASLIQGLRDYFGAHTYRRSDADGYFHTRWGQDGKEVPA